MTGPKKTQLLIIGGAVVLFVLLYFAPKSSAEESSKKEIQPKAPVAYANIESFVNTATGMLAPEARKVNDAYLEKKSGTEKLASLDSLVEFWNKLKRPDVAAFYFEKKAEVNNKALDWFKAGDRYYYSVRFVKDQEEIPALYQSAMRCYESGLKLEPSNTEARIMLASCYVESSADPMKGISMLKEIEKTDSNNVTLQLNFAFFSVKSQQWDKAIKRFEKVLQIDSTYIEAYLHLADAYEQMGDKKKTIEMLEKYAAKTDDILTKQEITKYINQLKTN
jgi:tetratricopeptide (TPR) repeat protein